MSRRSIRHGANRLYYYSSGQKIPLQPDDRLVALDSSKIGELTEAVKTAVPLSGSLLLVDKRELTDPMVEKLQKLAATPGATYDVFTAKDAKLVVMPEVRVEVDTVAQDKRIKQLLRKRQDIKIEEHDGQYNLTVSSSRDALDLANEIWETARPAASHPRFLRITRRPDTRS
jgi:hypothetical protein